MGVGGGRISQRITTECRHEWVLSACIQDILPIASSVVVTFPTEDRDRMRLKIKVAVVPNPPTCRVLSPSSKLHVPRLGV